MPRATQTAYSAGKRFSWVGMAAILILGFLFYLLIQRGQWTVMYLGATIGCVIFFIIVALDLGIKTPERRGDESQGTEK